MPGADMPNVWPAPRNPGTAVSTAMLTRMSGAPLIVFRGRRENALLIRATGLNTVTTDRIISGSGTK
jgi:hypothetical protein